MKKYFAAVSTVAIITLSIYILNRTQLSEIAGKLASEKMAERIQGYHESMTLDQAGRNTPQRIGN